MNINMKYARQFYLLLLSMTGKRLSFRLTFHYDEAEESEKICPHLCHITDRESC